MTRHLAYCQPCRRKARLAGVDESFVKPRSIAAKIAALLPFPLLRWPWGGGGKAAARGSRSLTKAGAVKSAAGAARHSRARSDPRPGRRSLRPRWRSPGSAEAR